MPSCSPGGVRRGQRKGYARRTPPGSFGRRKNHILGVHRGHEAFLEEKEIEELNIAGVDSEGAVLATMFSLIDAGYQVKIWNAW